jgi:hypothetical protein
MISGTVTPEGGKVNWIDQRAGLKMNLFMFPYGSRTNLSPQERSAYTAAVTHTGNHCMRFLAQLGLPAGYPDARIPPFDQADYDEMIRIYTYYYNLGAREFTNGLDDMYIPGGRGANWGYYHCLATNTVRKAMKALSPSCVVWMTPTPYAGLPSTHYWGHDTSVNPPVDHEILAADGNAYLRQARSMLNTDVPIHWTGPDVFSPSVTNAQADAIANLTGRAPFFWDNDVITWETNKQPLTGRPPDFWKHVSGYLGNKAYGYDDLSKQRVLVTIADYLWNPEAYNSSTIWDKACTYVANQRQLP